MRIQTTHAHNTRQRRMTTKRASTTWLRPGATSTPRHAPPTSPRRHLREPRAKPALLALRAATLTPLQPQRKEEGVAVSLYRLPLAATPPPARPSPSIESKAPSCVQGQSNPARHCHLRAGNQVWKRHKEQRQGWVQGGETQIRPRPQNGEASETRHLNSTQRMSTNRMTIVENAATAPTPPPLLRHKDRQGWVQALPVVVAVDAARMVAMVIAADAADAAGRAMVVVRFAVASAPRPHPWPSPHASKAVAAVPIAAEAVATVVVGARMAAMATAMAAESAGAAARLSVACQQTVSVCTQSDVRKGQGHVRHTPTAMS